MHMADALLSPEVGLTMCMISATAIVVSSAKLHNSPSVNVSAIVPLMAVLGAFVFSAQMINFTIPFTGSSGHLGGGLLLAILLGPWAGVIAISSILFVQALIFADGGILALGCNIFNLGIIPCLLVYPFIYKPLSALILKSSHPQKRQQLLIFISAIFTSQIGALAVVIETYLSGISALPFITFMWFMQPIHLAIGIGEGLITAMVVAFIYKNRSDVLTNLPHINQSSSPIKIKLPLIILISSIIIGGGISHFASEYPDGLEWSIAKIDGEKNELVNTSALHQSFAKFQNDHSLMPDYKFANNTSSAQSDNYSTTIAGIFGSLITLIIIALIGIVAGYMRPKP